MLGLSGSGPLPAVHRHLSRAVPTPRRRHPCAAAGVPSPTGATVGHTAHWTARAGGGATGPSASRYRHGSPRAAVRGSGDWRPSPTLTWPRSCISFPDAVWRIIALCLWCRPRAALAATSPHMRKLLNDIHPEYTLLRTETFLGLRRRRVWRHRPIRPGHSGSSNSSEWCCSSEATITDPATSDLEGAWATRRGVPPTIRRGPLA